MSIAVHTRMLEELSAYLQHWKAEYKRQLGLGAPLQGTVGVSFDPAIELTSLPAGQVISTGIYVCRQDPTLLVELVRQDVAADLFLLEVMMSGDAQPKAQAISPDLFHRFFERAPALN